jgi:hypothetical protein
MVPVIVTADQSIELVLGTDDVNDLDYPDLVVERRRNGWMIMLNPVGGGNPSGYVFFLDDGRSFLIRQPFAGAIHVTSKVEKAAEVDRDEPLGYQML